MNDESTLAGDGDAVYGSFDAWLWRPKPWPQGMRGKLFVRSPPDISMSVPFHRDESGGYDIPISAWSYMARGAIGKLKREEIDIAGARFSTATLPGTAPSASRQGIRRFIEGAATAVATIDGRMPTDRVQVLLLPGGHGRRTDPVRFGMAMRGGGASVALRISDAASDSHLYGEWIGVHELAHLWLPPIDAESMWLSEGLASYYQCVLRSRTGMYDEAQAWDELVSGFERGRAQAGQTLLEGARRPRYQQIYWGGAAILFKIDVALRRSGTGSLDAAVAAVRRSVSSDDPEAPDAADEMVARLSRAAGRDLQPIVAEALVTPFPDTTTELRELGIVRHGDAIRLDDAAPLAHVRKAIASRR